MKNVAAMNTAAEGLDLQGYSFKWKQAQEMAQNPREYEDSRHLLPYWERVRLFFLELGGQFTDDAKKGA